MTGSSLLKMFHGAALGILVTLILAALSPSVGAEDIPKFSSPEINAFVAKYVGYIDAYVKAAADKDDSKMQDLSKQVIALLTNEGPAIDAKLTAEERPRFEKFMDAYSQKWQATDPKK